MSDNDTTLTDQYQSYRDYRPDTKQYRHPPWRRAVYPAAIMIVALRICSVLVESMDGMWQPFLYSCLVLIWAGKVAVREWEQQP